MASQSRDLAFHDLSSAALATLAAEEGMTEAAAILATALPYALPHTEPGGFLSRVGTQSIATRSSHGSLTFFSLHLLRTPCHDG